MEQLVPVLAIVMIVAAGVWFQYRLSRGRMWTPLWLAFSATAASIMFIAAGTMGYNLDTHSRFIARTPWSPAVIWWEVGVGLVLAVLSAFLWRQGVRSQQTR
jgi:hypothetical protein